MAPIGSIENWGNRPGSKNPLVSVNSVTCAALGPSYSYVRVFSQIFLDALSQTILNEPIHLSCETEILAHNVIICIAKICRLEERLGVVAVLLPTVEDIQKTKISSLTSQSNKPSWTYLVSQVDLSFTCDLMQMWENMKKSCILRWQCSVTVKWFSGCLKSHILSACQVMTIASLE